MVGSERRKSFVEYNGISCLTARLTSRAETKVVIVIRCPRGGPSLNGKGTPGITG